MQSKIKRAIAASLLAVPLILAGCGDAAKLDGGKEQKKEMPAGPNQEVIGWYSNLCDTMTILQKSAPKPMEGKPKSGSEARSQAINMYTKYADNNRNAADRLSQVKVPTVADSWKDTNSAVVSLLKNTADTSAAKADELKKISPTDLRGLAAAFKRQSAQIQRENAISSSAWVQAVNSGVIPNKETSDSVRALPRCKAFFQKSGAAPSSAQADVPGLQKPGN